MLALHQVFLIYLGATLVWNLAAAFARLESGSPGRPRLAFALDPFGALALLLQLLATFVLLHDRLVLPDPAWLQRPWPGAALVTAHGLALLSNLVAVRQRGFRPSDVAFVLHGTFLLVVLGAAWRVAGGARPGALVTTTLHAHSVAQLLLGTPLAQGWTLSWHVPLLSRRDRAPSLPLQALGLAPAALAGFLVLVPCAVWASSADVLASFEAEPRLVEPLRADLAVGVADLDPLGAGPRLPGDLAAWVLPWDHPGDGLAPPTDGRPLVLELRPPDGWLTPPGAYAWPEGIREAVLAGSERLAARLRPDVLLPVAEPDGETSLWFPPGTGPDAWADLIERTRALVRAVSPGTRLGVRLAGRGERSQALFARLAPLVDVIGPRLAPGGPAVGGARAADDALLEVHGWWSGLPAEQRPEFWLLAVGCSPLAFGAEAQARFVEGQLARAQALPDVRAVLVDRWQDRGATRGLLHPDGSPRLAAGRLARWLHDR